MDDETTYNGMMADVLWLQSGTNRQRRCKNPVREQYLAGQQLLRLTHRNPATGYAYGGPLTTAATHPDLLIESE